MQPRRKRTSSSLTQGYITCIIYGHEGGRGVEDAAPALLALRNIVSYLQ